MKKILLLLLIVVLALGVTAFGVRRCAESDGTDAFCFSDDEELHFGTGLDVDIGWFTDDADAHYLGISLPSISATDVPVLAVGIGLDGVDLGFFTGSVGESAQTQPAIVLVDLDRDSWIGLDWSADDTPRLSVGGNAANLMLADLDLGASGTAGTLDIFPSTASMGKLAFAAANSAGNTTTTVTNVSQAGARTYTIPDAGASAYFVMGTSAQAVAGTLTRADLTEEALAVYGLPANWVCQDTGEQQTVSETAGTFNLSLSANVWLIKGEVANNETETSEGAFQFILPPEYVAAGDVKIRVKHRAVGAGTLGASTTDIEVFEQDGNGAIGADVCTTVAATMLDDTWTTTDFVVTGTDLVAGDILNVVLTTVVVESASSDINAEIDGIAVLLDIKG